MPAYHIHIRGRVQGVGFRPAVASLAEARRVNGTVSNGRDGVHIILHTCETVAKDFLDTLMTSPPEHSIITGYVLEEWEAAAPTPYPLHPTPFSIIDSDPTTDTDLLLTPDIAICDDCRAELTSSDNRRTCYAFTTCLHCGPRYSITTALPYDRANTTMAGLDMCAECSKEYTDIRNRRHYSQTNSCPDCAIPMHWYPAQGLESPLTNPLFDRTEKEGDLESALRLPSTVFDRQHAVIHEVSDALLEGKIVAIKGIGGYLLCCDATNPEVVQRLRARKHRPHKPFAVLYPDLATAMTEHDIRPFEAEALLGPVAPIVLCRRRGPLRGHPPGNPAEASPSSGDPTEEQLSRTGIMLPYTPLLTLISRRIGIPIVATSGNLSGSPILYRDEAALDLLWDVADAVLTYEREIVVPQDDSVWQFTDGGERIILRRSRGMAPDYFPHSLGVAEETVFASGADLKSAFALHHGDKVYVSQYLGDLEDYRAQQAWNDTRDHLLRLVEAQPKLVLTDLHPSYYARQESLSFAERLGVPAIGVPHHEAHVAAVLEENGLLRYPLPVLGIAWDGTGYGTDGHAWGSETFIVEKSQMDRVLHLDYFPQLLGDKMSREPRLSALSLLQGHHDARKIMQEHFNEAEWDYYQKLLQQPASALTSSMGRLIDGVASILGIQQYNSYEGQAAMELEALADSVDMQISTPYPFIIRQNRIDWRPMLQVLLGDRYSGVPREMIARRFFASLAQLVIDTAWTYDIPRIAVSGGVFQNALLLDLIRQRLPQDITLYTHQQLSPNDECIALGQLAWYKMKTLTPHFAGQASHPSPNT